MNLDIKYLIGNFSKNLTEYKSPKTKYNEHSTRIEYIDPFFECLGWDVSNRKGVSPTVREVIPEYILKNIARPDYTFSVNGIKKFFVEAKKPAIDIINDPEPSFQSRSYGWSAGHYISVLTNFEYLLIYDATVPPKNGDDAYTALLKKYHYSEYESKWEEINNILSRKTVYSGDFDNNFNYLKESRDYQSVDSYFLKQINNWRVALANELLENYSDYTIDYLNDITQNFINQMIFLRICEDRNLPIYHKLQETIQDEKKIKDELIHVLKNADKKYNSGLFVEHEFILELSNRVIMEIIQSLYYPQSPYIFSVIEANILGEIYELFLSEKLTLTEQNKVVLRKRKENENRDVVSTPNHIVKIMVNKTLKPLCKGKTPKEIYELRIADISCGSGIFLLEVYDYLIDYVTKWYLQSNPTYLIEVGENKYSLPFEDKKDILQSCIFGIDIDPNAVEVAKFSLLLKLLENESTPTLLNKEQVLPYLDNNIKQGNALIEFAHINKLNICEEDRFELSPFNWNFRNEVTTFDAIIGNPPYVTTEGMINLLPNIEYELYKKKYQSSFKQFDKYFIFIERALEKLNENGILTYIIPNKFSKIKSGEKLRKLLTKHSYVKEFIDFNSEQLFKNKGVTTYSSILILQKNTQSTFTFEEVNAINQWWVNHLSSIDNKERIVLDSRILSDASWVLVANKEKAKLVNQLYKNTIPLGNGIAEIFNGIQTSAESPYPVYWFTSEQILKESSNYIKFLKNDKEVMIEKNILRPYFKPTKRSEKNMSTYDPLNINKWIIFPYDSKGKIIPLNEMKVNYPNTFSYLQQNYERLLPKQVSGNKNGRDVPHATEDTWYHYGRIQALTRFINTPKLIVGILTRNPLYLYDDTDMLIASGGTAGYCAIAEKEGSPYKLEFIQAVLNHPAIEWLTSIIGSDFDNGFHSRGTSVLENLPIIQVDFNDENQAKMYYNIVTSTQRIYQINKDLQQKLDKRKSNALINEKQNLVQVIQSEVSHLYNIESLLQVIT